MIKIPTGIPNKFIKKDKEKELLKEEKQQYMIDYKEIADKSLVQVNAYLKKKGISLETRLRKIKAKEDIDKNKELFKEYKFYESKIIEINKEIEKLEKKLFPKEKRIVELEQIISPNKEDIVYNLLELRETKIKELWDINQEIKDLEQNIESNGETIYDPKTGKKLFKIYK